MIFSDCWNLGDYCREKRSEQQSRGLVSLGTTPRMRDITFEQLERRVRTFDDENIMSEPINYMRKCFDILPKTVLRTYASRNKISLPIYESKRTDRLFYAIVTFQEKKYASVIYHGNWKCAEQAAALVCSFRLGLFEEDFLLSTGSLIKHY